MSRRLPNAGSRATLPSGIVHSHFSVSAQPPQQQLLAWRDRVGHVIDVVPTSGELDQPFHAAIDRYDVGDMVFTDCRSDAMQLERSLARISTDKVRDFALHVFLDGGVDEVALRRDSADATPNARLLALDMGQPVRMHRGACRVLTFFVPGVMVEEVFPDREAIHGRVMPDDTPLARLAIAHAAALGDHIAGMTREAASDAVRDGAQMLVSAFGKQSGLSGSARAAARAAMFGQVRRHIQANLHRADLSPDTVLAALDLPRPTLYRLFQHEGGLGTYIRHLRLRHAADDLIRFPQRMVTDVAYGVGFNSASDFTRAFKRAYGMAPQDFRAMSLAGAKPDKA